MKQVYLIKRRKRKSNAVCRRTADSYEEPVLLGNK